MAAVRIAVLDLYEGEPNEGMRCIRQLVEHFRDEYIPELTYEVFDVRQRGEVPGTDFDAYISSGGPGSPLESEGSPWEEKFFGLMDVLKHHNSAHPFERKHVLLICHSFQLYCRQYNYATVKKRKSTAFGVMSMHLTRAGHHEPLFKGLPDPFFAVDSRDYQIVEPNEEKIWSGSGHILCIEKERPHVELERAVMAIRFDEAFVGMQFHPEADSDGMYKYLLRDDKKQAVVSKHGEKKYYQMLQYINEPDKVKLTYRTVVPRFLKAALLAGEGAIL